MELWPYTLDPRSVSLSLSHPTWSHVWTTTCWIAWLRVPCLSSLKLLGSNGARSESSLLTKFTWPMMTVRILLMKRRSTKSARLDSKTERLMAQSTCQDLFQKEFTFAIMFLQLRTLIRAMEHPAHKRLHLQQPKKLWIWMLRIRFLTLENIKRRIIQLRKEETRPKKLRRSSGKNKCQQHKKKKIMMKVRLISIRTLMSKVFHRKMTTKKMNLSLSIASAERNTTNWRTLSNLRNRFAKWPPQPTNRWLPDKRQRERSTFLLKRELTSMPMTMTKPWLKRVSA